MIPVSRYPIIMGPITYVQSTPVTSGSYGIYNIGMRHKNYYLL